MRIKYILRLLAGGGIFIFLFLQIQTLLIPKNHSLLTMDDFYQLEKDSVDILFLGSSHVVYGVNCEIIENITNKKTVSCAIIGQQAPVHISYLQEILKYQHPQLLVIDIYRFRLAEPFSYPPLPDLHESTNGLKFSSIKLQCIMENTMACDVPEFLFPVIRYHNRWAALTKTDFKYLLGKKESSHKGFRYTDLIVPQKEYSIPVLDNRNTSVPLPEPTKSYLDRIVETAKEYDIKLLFIDLPYTHITSNDVYMYYEIEKYLTKKCAGSHVEFQYLEYNEKKEDIQLDCSNDFMDYSHLNASGADKVSTHLANYILNHYE